MKMLNFLNAVAVATALLASTSFALTVPTKHRCLNPAAFGCRTCHLHGARKRSSIKVGVCHLNHLHGTETLLAKRQRSLKLGELREIENDLLDRGLIKGKRTSGRKPVIG